MFTSISKILICSISTLKHILQQELIWEYKGPAAKLCCIGCMRFILSFWNCINYVLRSLRFTWFSHLLAVTEFIIHCMFKACYVFCFFKWNSFFLCTSPTYLLKYMIKKAGETCWVQCYSENCINQVPLEDALKAHGAESTYLLYICVCKYNSLLVKEMEGLCTSSLPDVLKRSAEELKYWI